MPIVVSSLWSSALPVEANTLKKRVAQLYGLEDDADALQQAGEFLDETVDDLNTYLWQFMRRLETSVAMTASTRYVTLSDEFYRENFAYLVKTSDSHRQPPLIHLPWTFFQRAYNNSTATGTPNTYAFFNSEHEGRMYLFPTPDAAAAADYTISVEYYARIPRVTEQSPLQIPREMEVVLLYGAQRRFASNLLGTSDKDVAALSQLEADAIGRLRTIDQTNPDQLMRFRLVDRAFGSQYAYEPGAMYIKVR